VNFGVILKELRQERNLTQKQLADEISYSKAIIGFWENGKKEPTASALMALSDFFNVSVGFILGLESD